MPPLCCPRDTKFPDRTIIFQRLHGPDYGKCSGVRTPTEMSSSEFIAVDATRVVDATTMILRKILEENRSEHIDNSSVIHSAHIKSDSLDQNRTMPFGLPLRKH